MAASYTFERLKDGRIAVYSHYEDATVEKAIRDYGYKEPPPEPLHLSPFARALAAPIVFFARLLATCIALALWIFPVAPVWLALLLRTIAVFGWATVINLFTGKNPPDQARLEYISAFWVHGFNCILNSFRGQGSLTQIIPRAPQYDPIGELVIACLFYLWLITTLAFIDYWLWIVKWVVNTLYYILSKLFALLYSLLERIWNVF